MPRKRLPEREKQEQLLQQAIEATVTDISLSKYPVFNISRTRPTDNRVVFREQVKTPQGTNIERVWTVRVALDLGWPGEHDAEVWRAIERILILRRKQGLLTTRLDTSFSEIRQHMSGSGTSGSDLNRIKGSIKRLSHTSVDADFFIDSKKLGLDEQSRVVHLIAGYDWHQRRLPDDRVIIDSLTLYFDERLITRYNEGQVRPIDKGLRDNLGKWISKRLYELLGPGFYALRHKKVPYQTRYSRWCALIGITRQQYLSYARRILGRPHKEMQEAQYIAKVEWYPCIAEPNDWVLHYWPGPIAKAEWGEGYWQEMKKVLKPLFVEEVPESAAKPVWVELPPDDPEATGELETDREESEESSRAQWFEQEALALWNQLTGTRKHRWSRTEREDLADMHREGVTLNSVRTGIRACLENQRRKDIREPIQGLGYVRNWIWQAHRGEIDAAAAPLTAREKGETAKADRAATDQARAAWETAKAAQTEALRERQGNLLADLRKKITPIGFELNFTELLVIEDRGAAGLVLLVPSAQKARDLRRCYGQLLASVAGVPVEIRP